MAYHPRMRHSRLSTAILASLLFLGIGSSHTSAQVPGKTSGDKLPTALEFAIEPMIAIGDSVWVAQIGQGLWVVSFTGVLDSGTVYPANGMLLETKTGSVVVDPGWSGVQAKSLLRWAREYLGKPVTTAVVTHSHADRTGGIEELAKAEVKVLALGRTRAAAEKAGLTHLPDAVPELETKAYRDPAGFELFFPGAGHTPDNIVVYFPMHRVVFGGCLVKSETSPDLGNLADAVMADYPGSIERVMRAYPERRIVVPGHGSIAGDPLSHTLKLLHELEAKSKP